MKKMHTRISMKKSVLALAAIGACFGQAHAQTNVSVYGRVVAGIDYSTNVSSNGVTSGSRWGAASNQWGTSMLGFRGSEDLGGGLKAVFDLESGFSSNNGATNNPALFNRFAYVGLSGSAGTVKFGNFLSISNDVWFLDPLGQQWLGSASLVKGRSWNGAANSVQYESPNMNGFTANVQYSFGEKAGSTSANSKAGVSLAYVQPAYEVRAIYDVARDATGGYSDIYNTSEEFTLGGTLTLGPAKLFATYQNLSAPDAAAGAPTKAKHYWLGVNYQATPALQLIGAAFHVAPNNGADSANLYAIGANYSLSKRTLLYTTVGTVQNGANATFSERYWEPHVAGQNQTSVYAGVSHSF
jgi:predicted porin